MVVVHILVSAFSDDLVLGPCSKDALRDRLVEVVFIAIAIHLTLTLNYLNYLEVRVLLQDVIELLLNRSSRDFFDHRQFQASVINISRLIRLDHCLFL